MSKQSKQNAAALCLLVGLAISGLSVRLTLAKSINFSQQQQQQQQQQAGELSNNAAAQRYLRTLLPHHQLVPFRSFISSEQVRAQFAHLSARAGQPKQQAQQTSQPLANNRTLGATNSSSHQPETQQTDASTSQSVSQMPAPNSGSLIGPSVTVQRVAMMNQGLAPSQQQQQQQQQQLQVQQSRQANQSRTGSEYEQSASSAQVQLSESGARPAPQFMMVAQSRHRGTALAPAPIPSREERRNEPEEFGHDDQEEIEEQPAPRAALRPAQMPSQGRRHTAASNRRQFELDDQGEEPAHGPPRYAPRPQSRSSPVPPRARQAQQQRTAAESQDAGEAAAKQQEAAEASEAEIADKSALDEQQQAQREIILAQAQSEAKAIKEQQEALTRLQNLQQQMILRRQNDLDKVARGEPRGGSASDHHGGSKTSASSNRQKKDQKKANNRQEYNGDEDSDEQVHQGPAEPRWPQNQDYHQPSNNNNNNNNYYPQAERAGHFRYQPNSVGDETMPEGSFRQTAHSELNGQPAAKFEVGHDLVPAAQSSYGVLVAPRRRHQMELD